tara:strand:- start:369 stop:1421 length:1053 start_codon:yes stop_codon:yes gene_type:complete
MIYFKNYDTSAKSIRELCNDVDLNNIYNELKGCKNISSNEIYKLGHNFIHYKTLLNESANNLLKYIKDTRMSDLITDWKHFDKNFVLPSSPKNNLVFDAVKLHWLVNDVKINGLGYPPQGYILGTEFVCHPGTYRFNAAFAQQLETPVSVWDSNNIFDKDSLSLSQWVNFCSNGFLRNKRNLEIKCSPDTKKYLEIHEIENHHDWNIYNQDRGLGKMFNKKLPVIFSNCDKKIKELKKFINTNVFSDIDFVYIEDKFLIPSKLDFKGVGIYIDKKVEITEDIAYLVLYLDINDDCASALNNDILVFNCSSHNCKKLIPPIVEESTYQYLENLSWASKVSFIPGKIINEDT